MSDEANLRFPITSDSYEKYSKLGWYVNSIKTNKQSGNIKEFIEKEGKWFNYIKGDPTASLSTSEFSFQGLGIVENVTATSGSSTTSGGGSGSTNGSTNGSGTNSSGGAGGGGTGGGGTGGGTY